jgi:hypothetical protein
MKLYDFLQLSVCVFSVLAAGFWLQSTTNRLPKLASNSSEQGTGTLPKALISQSRWIAAGAACAGVAALAESMVAVLPYARLH